MYIGDYGCLFSMGAYYSDFMVIPHPPVELLQSPRLLAKVLVSYVRQPQPLCLAALSVEELKLGLK
jgi:hypothetical protein